MKVNNAVRWFLLVCLLAVLSVVGMTAASAKPQKLSYPVDRSSTVDMKVNYSFVDDYEVPSLVKYVQGKSTVRLSEYQAKTIVTTALREGRKLNVDPTLVLAVAEVESSFNPKSKNPHSSAYGLMQVIPYWHKEKIRNRDMRLPVNQITVGTEVLAEYIDSGGSIKSGLKSYSGGSARYANKVLTARNAIRLHLVQEILKVPV
jgi:soluble lytic murein transglycosylase-like protein